jgi:PKD repeat protein
MRKVALVLLTVTLLLLGGACGGPTKPDGTAAVGADPGFTPAVPAEVDSPVHGTVRPDAAATPGLLTDLDTPGLLLERLAGYRAAAFSPAEGHRDGAQYEALAVNNRVAPAGSALTFTPQYTSAGADIDGLAYALYDFVLPSPNTGLNAAFNWSLLPAQPNLFLALGNFDSNTWDWVAPADVTSIALADATAYFSVTDHLLLLVAVTGSSNAALAEIQLEGVEVPIADLTANADEGLVPLAINFDASGSTDADGTIANYEWDFDGNGIFNEASAEAAAEGDPTPAELVYVQPGNYNAAVRVTDDDGNAATAELLIQANVAPTVILNADVTSGDQPLLVTYTATAADANGTVASIEWDFNGNGIFGEAGAEATAADDPTPTPYNYTVPGSFDAAVTVTDNQNASAGDTVTISVGSPPSVNLTAVPTSGDKPLPVTFTATAADPGGSITDIEWDFDGDGTYNEAGAEAGARGDATPAVYNYTAVGTYPARVRVTDNSSGTAIDTADITVSNTPPVADLQSDVLEGDAPFFVTYDASASSDPGGSITNYEWDFNGNGSYSEAGPEADAEGNPTPAAYQYLTPGLTTARVRVTDDDGANAAVSLIITRHGWVVVPVDDVVGVDGGYWGDIAIVNGRPAIAARDGSGNSIRYSYAGSVTGTGAWTTIVVPTPGITTPGREISLAQINGYPAMSYCDTTASGDMIYQRSTTPSGTSPGDWIAPVHIQDTGDVGYHSQLLEVVSAPAIAYDDITNGDLRYAHAQTLWGDDIADWTTNIVIDSPAGGSANGCSMALVGGNPAVAYFYWDGAVERMRFCRSSTTDGNMAANWATKTTLNTGPAGISVAELLTQYPAISYVNTNTGAMSYVSATNVAGTAWNPAVTVQAAVGGSNYTALLLFDGNPTVAFYELNLQDVVYSRSSTPTGNNAGDWAAKTTVDGSSSNVGRYVSLIEVTGRPALYYRSDSAQCTMYAIRF